MAEPRSRGPRLPRLPRRAPPPLPWARPRRELLLLTLLAIATLSPAYGLNAQDVSRLCLTRALVHDGRLYNDPCLGTTFAVDRAEYRGRFYSDKAPGMSVLEIPGALVANVPNVDLWLPNDLRLWVARVLSSGIAFLVCAFLIGRVSEGLAPGYGGLSLVAFGLGTLVAPFAAANFGAVTAAQLGLTAFILAWRERPLLAGLAAGAALTVEYQAGVVLLIVGLYVALQGPWPIVNYIRGVLPGAALLWTYNWLAFGAPWHLSYRYVSNKFAADQSGGFFGIHVPTLHGLREVFVGGGGVLVISPVVVAAGFGLVLLGRRYRAEAIICGAVTAVFFLINSGYFSPYGGVSPGPRFLIPSLPFLALGLGPAFAARFRTTTMLTLLSIIPMTALTLTWDANATGSDTIWGDLARLPIDLGSSAIVRHLTSNVLSWAGPGKQAGAVLVTLAATWAFALALVTTIRSNRARESVAL